MAESDQPKSSFWTSLAGVLTGVGTLVAALAAVMALLVSNNASPSVTPASLPSSAPAPNSAPAPSPSQTRVADDWPAYPGPADVGSTGRAALGWQAILIKCGAISDIAENHDGVYGTATGEKVEQLESHWGWLDADTTADRLTYNHIVNAGCS
jgi:hypothetical protein